MEKRKILLLEDNEIIRDGIITYLKDEYDILGISSIGEFNREFIRDVELFILDINLPDGNAYDIVPAIKNLNKPIIFLTIRDSEEDILKGFNIGGDDYVTKPFKLSILKARIESILRRSDISKEEFIYFEEMILDIQGTKLYINNKEIELSKKEYLLMEMFLKNVGRTIPRDMLMEIAWDSFGEFVNDNALSVSIRRLREKLGEYGNKIKTVRGLGYKFE